MKIGTKLIVLFVVALLLTLLTTTILFSQLRTLASHSALPEIEREAAKSNATLTIAVSGLLLVLVGVPGLLELRRLLRNLNDMSAVAMRTAVGDTSQTIDYRSSDEIGALANSFRAIQNMLKERASVAARLATAEPVDQVVPLSEADVLGKSLAMMVANIGKRNRDMKTLIAHMMDGDLAYRVDVSGYEGGNGKILTAVNQMLDALVSPVNVAAEYVERISKGDIPPKITHEYKGDFNKIRISLNACIDTLDRLVSELNRMAARQKAGDYDVYTDPAQFVGVYRQLSEGVNDLVKMAITDTLDVLTAVGAYGDGNLEVSLRPLPGKKAVANRQVDTVRDNIKALVADVNLLVDAASAQGRLDVRADASRHHGEFRKIVEGINKTLDTIALPFVRSIEHLEKLSQGIIGTHIERLEYRGEFIRLLNGFNGTFAAINKLIEDSLMLAEAGVQGRLDVRADVSRHQGDFRKIVEGVNATLDAVVTPMKDVEVALGKLADGDFTVEVTKEYAGEFNVLKDSVNAMTQQVRGALLQIGENTATLAASSEQLGKVSQQMSASAEETAAQANVVSAASEQVSNNIQTVATGADEMGASIKEISKSTATAGQIASNAVILAQSTNETVLKLGTSSAEIGQVIKVITSIAQQTNLLALNATIEAARAGEAGKGFAVVANEVKELANQTAKATEDISQKIQAIQSDAQGAVAAIGQITDVIGQINDITNTIASAVEEQSATTNEISRNLAEAAKGGLDISRNITGVAQAAQTTTEAAGQTQHAAGGLEQMAAQLKELVSQFRFEQQAERQRTAYAR